MGFVLPSPSDGLYNLPQEIFPRDTIVLAIPTPIGTANPVVAIPTTELSV